MEQIFAVDIKSLAPANFTTFGDIVSIIVRNAVVLAGIISFVLLIFGGFGVIVNAGSGDAKKLEESKKAVTAAVTGLIIIVTSVLIVQLIATVTGADVLKQMLGTK